MHRRTKRRIKFWLFILLIGFLGFFFLKAGFTVSQIVVSNNPTGDPSFTPPPLPDDDPNRINVLLLGMRGIDEPGDGKLLTDTMIVLSFDKIKKKAALISIPRDLYVYIWGLWEKKKINAAFAYGGFDGVQKTVSLATNQNIDYVVGVNFHALEELVDTLGGINIYLREPFEESFQWVAEGREGNRYWVKREFEESATTTQDDETEDNYFSDSDSEENSTGKEKWVFRVPAGTNILDGAATLYYARSRFSSSDFDRMRRQQDVLMALKEKAFSLGVLTNPVKIYNLIDLLGKNVRTNMSLGDIREMVKLLSKLDVKNIDIKKEVFDASEGGLLYEKFINEEYVLLPIDDDFGVIWRACEDIFR